MSLPLTDLVVVEYPATDSPLPHRLALAMAGRIAADLGARVLTLDDDTLATLSVLPWETARTPSATALFLDRNKHRLAAQTLAQATTYAAVILTDRDLSTPPTPTQVHVLLKSLPSGYPDDGQCSELSLMALSGLLDMVGEPQREPLLLGGHQVAYGAGLALFSAMVSGLCGKAAHGHGDIYDVNALDVMAWINWKAVGATHMEEGRSLSREGNMTEWPVLACQDGWVVFAFTTNQWPSIVEMIGDKRLFSEAFSTPANRAQHRADYVAILQDWARGQSREQIQAIAAAARQPLAPVLDAHEVLTDPHNRTRGVFFETAVGPDERLSFPVLPVRWNGERFQSPETAPFPSAQQPSRERIELPSTPRTLPLAGVRVLDLGLLTAGAGTSSLLADAGAEVIKIEVGTHPDPFRNWSGGASTDEAHLKSVFAFTNRNKKGVELDLKSTEGRETFLQLVERSDVVVENFRRGVMDSLKLSFADLQTRNPAIVLVSVSSQGESGPSSRNTSYGSTLEALSGMAAAAGYSGEQPVVSGRSVNYPDQIVSLFAMGMASLAVLQARREGCGVHLDVPQRDVASFLMGDWLAAANRHPGKQANRTGNADIAGALQECFCAPDGRWVAVTIFGEQARRRLAALLSKIIAEVDDLRSWIATRPAEHSVQALQEIGVCAAVVATSAQASQTLLKTKSTALVGTSWGLLTKGFPFQSRATPFSIREPAPRLGEHTEAVISLVLAEPPRSV